MKRALQQLQEIKYEFSKDKATLKTVWAKMCNKIDDAKASLPQAAETPLVNYDFGDLYGLYYFITGDDYSHAE